MEKSIPVLEVKKIQKYYGKFQAVKDIDMEIKKGEIYALLGHNGAGKSTLIKIILGLINFSSGSIKIEGLTHEQPDIKKKIGYLPERMNFYASLTAWETITFYAKLKDVSFTRCEDVLEQVGLSNVKHRKVGTFSKGMQQRLGLAQAIIHKPDLLLLDEPTTGLDPLGILQLKDMIRTWNQEGTTIFFSSHNLGDVEELAHRIGIMHAGAMAAQGTLKELQQQLNLKTKFTFLLTNITEHLYESLAQKDFDLKIEENKIIVYCLKEEKAQVIRLIIDEGAEIRDLFLEDPGLDLVYLKLMENFTNRQ